MAIRGQRKYINISNVEPGMMIQFNYKKLSGETNEYVVLVIDPNRENEHASQPQLHGYLLRDFSDKELVDFFSSLDTEAKIDPKSKTPVIKDINNDEMYSKFATSKYVSNRPYRTFNLTGISKVRQILVGKVQ
jgi:hypothetical protein